MKILFCDYYLPQVGTEKENRIRTFFPDCEIETCRYIDDDWLSEKLQETDGLLTAHLHISRSVLERAAGKLKVISVDGTSYSNVDADAAAECGMILYSMGEYCTEEVADHAMMLILALEKNLLQYSDLIWEQGVYRFREISPRHKIAGKRLAIFGYGRIGRAVAERAAAFGYQVVAVPHRTEKIGLWDGKVEYVSKQEAFETADVIANHMNEESDNYDYFNREAFLQMKRHPLFVNLGRGSSVNEADLNEALQSGQISGAGLDVLKDIRPDIENHPLFSPENRGRLIVTPHSAFYSVESVKSVQTVSLDNLLFGLTGQLDKITNLA